MTEEKRFIIVTCFKTHNDDEIVLPWDPRLKFVSDGNDYMEDILGDITIEGKGGIVTSFLQYYDINTKTTLNGEIIDIYGESKEFKPGDLIVYEGESYKIWVKSRIKGYSYNDYDSNIMVGKNVITMYEGHEILTKIKIDPEKLYEIRTWSPDWEMEDGSVRKHYHIKNLKEE